MCETNNIRPPNADDPLRLDRCPDCGYLLTGLPERGICPECGFAYNEQMIVLYGWARNVRGSEGTQRPWAGWWAAKILFWLFVLVITSGAGLILLIIWLLIRSLRRRQLTADAPAPVQLRLVPEGFAQRDGVGPVKLCRWRPDKEQLIFKRTMDGPWHIRSWRHFLPVLRRSRVIDFEFDCDGRTMRRIEQQILQWRRQA